jgi:biotin operon repressor
MKGLGMSSLGETCRLLRVINDVAQPRRNISPGFNKAHILMALHATSKEPRNRCFLEKTLGIGEASVKTLVKRLKERGLVETSRHRGTVATDLGREIAGLVNSALIISSAKCSLTSSQDALVIIPGTNPPRNIVDVYKLRDHLVKSGCNISLIGGYDNNELVTPGIDKEYTDKLKQCILSIADSNILEDHGVFIFFPQDIFYKCLDGVLAFLLSRC